MVVVVKANVTTAHPWGQGGVVKWRGVGLKDGGGAHKEYMEWRETP